MLHWLKQLTGKRHSSAVAPAPGAEALPVQAASSKLMGADRALELIKRGNQFLDQGDTERAATAYRAAIESDPRCVAGYVNLGFALRSLGQLQDAADQLEKALALDPWQVDALFMLGLKAESDGNQELALRHLGTLLNLQPDFEHAVDAICRIHLQRQELVLARDAVERALQKNSGCAIFSWPASS